MGEKRKKGIVALLEWAFQDELPHDRRGMDALAAGPQAPRPGWAAMAGLGEMAVADGRPRLNGWGLVAAAQHREPHPDAMTLGRMVQALDDFLMSVPDGWAADADLAAGVTISGEAGAAEAAEWSAAGARAINRLTLIGRDGAPRLKASVAALVISRACIGRPPAVRAGMDVTRRYVLAANGRPAWFAREMREVGMHADGSPRMGEVEVSGTFANGRVKPGAYRKHVLEPDPADIMVERAEYRLWRAAIDVLAEDAAGALRDFDVLPCRLPYRPWLERGEGAPGRVLRGDAGSGWAVRPRAMVIAGPPLADWGTARDRAAQKKARAELGRRKASLSNSMAESIGASNG